jgi:HAMP domain-containing protein
MQFVWLLDLETGRGVAKNNEFKAGTADAYYYQKGIGEIFEGLAGATGQKVMQAVRGGTVYRDIWHTREELGDSLTGFVHVAMVPILGPGGNAVGLLAAAVRLENLARVARSAHAKVLLVRKVVRQGAEAVEIIGDGNDDLNTESLPEGLRKNLRESHASDFRAVAGLDPLDTEGKGVRPAFDFVDSGSTYLGQISGVVNGVGRVARGDATFAVGPVAVATLVDKTQAMEVLSTIWQIWIFTGAAFLIAIIAALILARSFLRPITLIEDGLLRIMNGDWTHRFDVRSAELGGLSYRINQLMAALLGDEEEGEMEAGEEPVQADPRDGYYQGLYSKFQAAQQQIKQDPNSVSFADFKARLVENERKILEKNPGKQVEFEILVQNNQITFKPIVK